MSGTAAPRPIALLARLLLALCAEASCGVPGPETAVSARQPVQSAVVSSELRLRTAAPLAVLLPALDAQVAFGGGVFLAVWQGSSASNDSILAMRVAPDGTMLDSQPLVVAAPRRGPLSPDVTFDGQNFLVVWQEGDLVGYYRGVVRAARVTPAGVVLNRPGLLVSAVTSSDAMRPRVAFNGTEALVVWQEGFLPTPRTIWGAFISPGGTPSVPVKLSTSTGDCAAADVAALGSDFLVVWEDARGSSHDIYGTRVRGRAVQDTTNIGVSTAANDQTSPAVACTSSTCLVTWADAAGAPWAARVSPAGAVLDAAGRRLSAMGALRSTTTVDFDGAQFVAGWTELRAGAEVVVVAGITTGGTLVNASGLVVATGTNPNLGPALAWDGTQHFMVWHDDAMRGNFGVRLTPTLAPLDTTPLRLANRLGVSAAERAQITPSVAFDGDNALVAWIERGAVLATRVSQSGRVLDQSPVLLAASGADVDVVAADAGFVVAWRDFRSSNGTQAYAIRMSPDGGLIGPEVLLASATTSPVDLSLVAAPGYALALFTHYEPASEGMNISARRVDFDGRLLEAAPFRIVKGNYNQVVPTGVHVGNQLLAFFSDWQSSQRIVTLQRVSDDGGLAGPSSLATPAQGMQFTPRVATTGSDSLLVVERDYDIIASLLEQDGRVRVSDIPVAVGGNLRTEPHVATDGRSYVVAWCESEEGDAQIYAREVFFDGGLGASRVVVATSTALEQRPRLTAVGPGRYLVAYTNFDVSDGTTRVGLRFISFAPLVLGDPCLESTECASGLCELERCATPDAGAPEQPRVLTVGCGCSEAPLGLTVLLVVMVARAGRRRRAVQRR